MPGPILTMRLRSLAELEALTEAAELADTTRGQWCRRVLLEAAGVSASEPPAAARARAMRRGEPDPWEVG